MAGKTYETNIRIGGQVSKSLGSSIKAANGQLGGFTKSLKGIAAVAAGAFAGIKIGQFAQDAVNTFKDFEQSMANTAAIAGIDKFHEDYAALEKAAMDAGKATSKTAKEAADALGYMKLAGWETTDAMKGLMPVLRLSEASGMELATASDMVTDTMSALGLSVDKTALNVHGLNGYLDIIAKTQNSANTNAQQLMSAYLDVGGTMKSLNVPMEESAAILGVMANRGAKGAEAGKSLNSILVNLTAPSGKAADALKALGYSAFDSQGNFLGLENSLVLLKDKLAGATDKQMQYFTSAIGGKTQLTALQQMLDGLGNEYFDLKGQILDNSGALDAMAETMNNTMTGAFARLNSAVDDFKINMVKKVEPYITPAINKIAEVLPNITDGMSRGLDNLVDSTKSIGSAVISNLRLDEAYQYLAPKMPAITASAKYFTTGFISGVGKFFKGESLSSAMQESMIGLKNVFTDVMGREKGDLVFSGLQGSLERLSAFVDIGREMLQVLQDKIQGLRPSFDNLTRLFDVVKSAAIEAADWMLGAFNGQSADAVENFSVLLSGVVDGINWITEAAADTTDFIKNNWNIVEPIIWGIVGAITAWKVISMGMGIVNGVMAAYQAVTKGASISQWLLNAAMSANPIGVVVVAIGALIAAGVLLYKNWDAIREAAASLWQGITETFTGIRDGIQTVLNSIIGFVRGAFTGDWGRAWQGVQDIFSGTFGAIGGLAKTPLNAAISLINGAIGGINGMNISIPDWVPGLGGKNFSINIPKIPMLAKGTDSFAGGMAIVGEQGPELVSMSRGSQVITNSKTQALIDAIKELFTVSPLLSRNQGALQFTSELASDGGGSPRFHIENKVQVVIQGHADKKDIEEGVKSGIEKAMGMTQEKFNNMMRQYELDKKRRRFA